MLIRCLLCLLLGSSAPAALWAQSPSDIFGSSKTPITYVGLDFSRVQLVGSSGFNDPVAIKQEYFDKWNDLVLTEFDKYDLRRAFVKEQVDFDTDIVRILNEEVDAANLVINKSATPLTRTDLDMMVGRYDFRNVQNNIAAVFVVESFDKIAEKGTFHLVFVNTKTNQIIFTDKVVGEPRGFGFRNYWAGALYDAIEQIRKKKWSQWKKAA